MLALLTIICVGGDPLLWPGGRWLWNVSVSKHDHVCLWNVCPRCGFTCKHSFSYIHPPGRDVSACVPKYISSPPLAPGTQPHRARTRLCLKRPRSFHGRHMLGRAVERRLVCTSLFQACTPWTGLSAHDGSSVDAAYSLFVSIRRSAKAPTKIIHACCFPHAPRHCFNAIGGTELFYAIDVVNSAFTLGRLPASDHRLGGIIRRCILEMYASKSPLTFIKNLASVYMTE